MRKLRRLRELKNLNSLNLNGYFEFDEEYSILNEIISQLDKLESLNVLNYLTEYVFGRIFTSKKVSLINLTIYIDLLSSEELLALSLLCPKLKYLELCITYEGTTDNDLIEAFKNMTSLEHLGLAVNNNVSCDFLNYVPDNMLKNIKAIFVIYSGNFIEEYEINEKRFRGKNPHNKWL